MVEMSVLCMSAVATVKPQLQFFVCAARYTTGYWGNAAVGERKFCIAVRVYINTSDMV